MKIDPGPLPVVPAGYSFGSSACGIKPDGSSDVALIVSDQPCTAAAVFTRNRCAAAPVEVGREHVADGRLQAVVVNAGNANAATGEAGLAVSRWSCEEAGRRLGVDGSLVLPSSTGVIGVPLPKGRLGKGIREAAAGRSEGGFEGAARAIMTSDAFPKWAGAEVRYGTPDGGRAGSRGESSEKGTDRTWRIAVMAKGAGMIHPDMATMLCYVLTDAPIAPDFARRLLRSAVNNSFNRISVDGDSSTNDMVLLLANGAAGGPELTSARSAEGRAFSRALTESMDSVARMIVADGEGATKVVDVVVEGARDSRAARRCARAVATSVLVKCALAGEDPNWGRVVMALGNCGEELDLSSVSLSIAGVRVAKEGKVVSARAVERAREAMAWDNFELRVDLGAGSGTATVVTSDLTGDYVHFNSAYTS